jgi:DNA-binding beta-propeller fold protein YncE
VYVASFDINAIAVFRRLSSGVLKQLVGTAGCVSEDGTDGINPDIVCSVGRGLMGAFSTAVSPDGKNVYVASLNSSAVAAFARDPATGALSQLAGMDGCVNDDGSEGCDNGTALKRIRSVAISPDGKHVYATSADSNAVTAFSRDPVTGALSQLSGMAGCVSEDGTDDVSPTIVCTDGKGLNGARAVTVSPDGKNVYVAASESDAVSVFTRDQISGVVTLTDCINQDGSDGCTDGRALDETLSVAVSSDGKHVYVASRQSSAVAVFARDLTTGALSQLPGADGCVSEDGSDGCAAGKALNGAQSVAVSLDGKNVYVASFNSSTVAIFKRN